MSHRPTLTVLTCSLAFVTACSTLAPAVVCGSGAALTVLKDTRLQKLYLGDGDPDTPLAETDLARLASLTDGTDAGQLPETHAVTQVDVPGVGKKGTGLRPNKQQTAMVKADPGLVREHLPILHAGTTFQTAAGPWRWGVQAAEPTAVDLRAQMPPVRDQGSRNTCYAFALAAVLDHAAASIPGATIKSASPQFLYWRWESEVVSQIVPRDLWLDQGMDPMVAWVILQPQGVTRGPNRPAIPPDRGYVSEAMAPYQDTYPDLQPGTAMAVAAPKVLGPLASRIATGDCLATQGATTVMMKNDTATLRMALADGLPIVIGYPLDPQDWGRTASDDVIPDLQPARAGQTGGHAVVLVGYQDDARAPGGGYFLLRNSWGPAWANQGYARISYAMTSRWGIDPHVVLAVSDTFSGRYGLTQPS